MIFGELPTAQAEGAILAHTLRAGGLVLGKGRVLGAADIARLQQAGVETVIAAKLDSGDVHEDAAANAIAAACAGNNIGIGAAFTGRANLFAAADGVAVVSSALVDAVNLAHESLTVATLAPYEPVIKGQMIATIKVIPFAAPRHAFERVMRLLGDAEPLLRIAPWRPRQVGLVSTSLPGAKTSLLAKNLQALSGRLAHMGSNSVVERRCAHAVGAVAKMIRELIDAGCSPVFVSGASAITDRGDIVPMGIIAAGGEVLHMGMPVDPGNLLLLGRLGDVPVVGLPSCARSPKLNGFDWVLQRLMADLPVSPADIMRMGAGGLLKEIATRPQPRLGNRQAVPHQQRLNVRKAPRIAAVILAAGRSQRMGARNKLLIDVRGTPMLRRAVAEALLAGANPVIVVTGHEADAVRAALDGCAVTFAHNADFALGLGGSLRAGVKALPDDVDGALVCLGDMPDVRAAHLQKLIAAFDPAEGRAICVPAHNGKRGNPVLFGAQFFREMAGVTGDTGARHLTSAHGDQVCEVAMEDAAILLDLDTPEAMAQYQSL